MTSRGGGGCCGCSGSGWRLSGLPWLVRLTESARMPLPSRKPPESCYRQDALGLRLQHPPLADLRGCIVDWAALLLLFLSEQRSSGDGLPLFS